MTYVTQRVARILKGISIHTALAGCDHDKFIWITITVCISIHTALAGCDDAYSFMRS